MTSTLVETGRGGEGGQRRRTRGGETSGVGALPPRRLAPHCRSRLTDWRRTACRGRAGDPGAGESTASRSSSNHTNPKPGGLRATHASLIWPKSRKKSRRSRASASGGRFPTKTCPPARASRRTQTGAAPSLSRPHSHASEPGPAARSPPRRAQRSAHRRAAVPPNPPTPCAGRGPGAGRATAERKQRRRT